MIDMAPSKGSHPPPDPQFFLNIVQKAFDPPPFVLNITLQIFFDGFLKKRVNVCRDKIRQNNA